MSDVREARTATTATHLEADETHRLISSEKVDGTAVYDERQPLKAPDWTYA